MKKLLAVLFLSILFTALSADAKVQHVRKYLNEPTQTKTQVQKTQAAAAAKINYEEESAYAKRFYSQNNLKNNYPTTRSNQK